MNYYNILKIKTNATDTEIKKAYRALAKKYHPDIYKGNKEVAQQKMQEINIAYDTLSNANLRKEYDRKIGINEVEEVKEKVTQTADRYYSKYDKSGVNYEVRYRPNTSKIKYDSEGYAAANYYTADEEETTTFTNKNNKKRIKDLNKTQKICCIAIMSVLALALVAFVLYKAHESLTSLINSVKDISTEINSAKETSERQSREDAKELKEQLNKSIENIKSKLKEESEKQNDSDYRGKTLEMWGVTDKEDQEKILRMVEELKKDET